MPFGDLLWNRINHFPVFYSSSHKADQQSCGASKCLDADLSESILAECLWKNFEADQLEENDGILLFIVCVSGLRIVRLESCQRIRWNFLTFKTFRRLECSDL